MKIDCAWAENYYVVKANLLHDRVHDPQMNYTLRGRKVLTSQPVYCDLPGYDIAGVVDCLEASPSAENGVRLDNSGRLYTLCIVEYKPTLPSGRDYNPDDAMQVFAQKVCVDFIFGCDCEAVLYYADAKKRVPLPFRAQRNQWDEQLLATLARMRACLQENRIPSIPDGQKCSGCSVRDLCMPTLKHRFTVRANSSAHWRRLNAKTAEYPLYYAGSGLAFTGR